MIYERCQRMAVPVASAFMKICFARISIVQPNDNNCTADSRPIVFISNHVTTADSWIALKSVVTVYNRKFILIANEEVLRRFPVLKKIGLFPVDTRSPFLNAKTFSVISRIMKQEAKTALWFFPQGHHFPQDFPLDGTFLDGITQLLKQIGECIVIPVGFYYYTFRKPQSSVAVYFGDPMDSDTNIVPTTKQLSELVHQCTQNAKEYAIQTANKEILYPGQKINS